ncbi:carbohydrate ABC transporter permease [Kaistia algarum]|uniref:carbohydrate ABC transporter permease n=1 Tax=Kaistia algarum TaxID=2083279 RepID=UPI00224CEA11|nr:sugar ABC transporter permease [Kaistia algarum]MCX5514949.1 sugar ABC transporter permease [Kaistia algarum]
MSSIPMEGASARPATLHIAGRAASAELRRWSKFIWVAPLGFALVITTLYPTIFLIALATTKSTLGKPFRAFVGMRQITGALLDPAFQSAVFKGVAFAFASAIAELVIGFALASLFVALARAGRYLLIVVLLPLMTPPVMVGVAWKLILAPSGGLLNGVLMNWGITDAPISFLATPVPAWLSIGVADLWQWVPFVTILCFAALVSLPDGVREASMIDGAGPWQRLRHVTLPLVAAPLASIFLLKLIIGFKLFDLVYVLTFGGPGFATTNATFGIWRLALEQFDVGKAAAQTLIYAVVISIVTIPIVRLHRFASEHYS